MSSFMPSVACTTLLRHVINSTLKLSLYLLRADDCQGCHVASSLDHLRVPPVLCTISEVLAHSLHPPTYVYPPPQPITAAYDYRPQSLPSYNQMHGIQNYDTSCYESRTSILSPHHHSNLRHKVHEQPPGNCKQQQLPYGHRSCDSVPLGLLNSKPLSCESLELNRSNSYFLLNTEVDMVRSVPHEILLILRVNS